MLAYTIPPSQPQSQTTSASADNANYWTPYGNRVYLDSIAASQPIQGQNQSIPYNTVQATLYNDYYQLSAPLGFDLRILGNERLQFNIGATIQPSYLLNTDSYILELRLYQLHQGAFRFPEMEPQRRRGSIPVLPERTHPVADRTRVPLSAVLQLSERRRQSHQREPERIRDQAWHYQTATLRPAFTVILRP